MEKLFHIFIQFRDNGRSVEGILEEIVFLSAVSWNILTAVFNIFSGFIFVRGKQHFLRSNNNLEVNIHHVDSIKLNMGLSVNHVARVLNS